MLPKQDLFVQSNGLTFHVQRIGRGSPLVMIMGLGAPGEKWKHNYELLGEHFECIVIDNRGAGQSDKPQAESYATDQMADDVLGIMDALNIQSAHVMGVSMGGAISQHIALKAPHRVRSLVLCSTFARATPAFAGAISVLRDLRGQIDPARLKQLNQWMTYGQKTLNERPELLVQHAAVDGAYPYPMPDYAYKAQCNACLGHDVLARLGGITAPTLVCAGEKDLFANLDRAKELAAGIPGARLFVTPEGGHVHQWEYPEAFDAAVLSFLQEQD